MDNVNLDVDQDFVKLLTAIFYRQNRRGDNLAWMSRLDLSRFNVIDLDAYGVPFEQLEILFKREYHGIVFVTFIQSLWGRMPKELLIDVGFTESMIEKAPAVCNGRGWEYLLE